MLLAGVIYDKLVDYDLYHLYGMVWYILIPIHAISLCQESHRINRTQRITNPMPTSAIPKTAAVCRLRLPPAPTQPSKTGQFHLFCLTFRRCGCLHTKPQSSQQPLYVLITHRREYRRDPPSVVSMFGYGWAPMPKGGMVLLRWIIVSWLIKSSSEGLRPTARQFRSHRLQNDGITALECRVITISGAV